MTSIRSRYDDWIERNLLRQVVLFLEGLLPTFNAFIHKRGTSARSNVQPFHKPLPIHSWSMWRDTVLESPFLLAQSNDWLIAMIIERSHHYLRYNVSHSVPRWRGVHHPITEIVRRVWIIARVRLRQIESVQVRRIASVCREPDTASRPPTNSLEILLTFTRRSLELKSYWVAWSACRIFFFLFPLSLYYTSRALEQTRRRAIITCDPESRDPKKSRDKFPGKSFVKCNRFTLLLNAYRSFELQCLPSTYPMYLYKRNELCIRRAYDVYLLDVRAVTLHRA